MKIAVRMCDLVTDEATFEKADQTYDGGRYWIRTSDPSDVNTVLYQLS